MELKTRKAGFYAVELNKTVWIIPNYYQNLTPLGTGAYGTVWLVCYWSSTLPNELCSNWCSVTTSCQVVWNLVPLRFPEWIKLCLNLLIVRLFQRLQYYPNFLSPIFLSWTVESANCSHSVDNWMFLALLKIAVRSAWAQFIQLVLIGHLTGIYFVAIFNFVENSGSFGNIWIDNTNFSAAECCLTGEKVAIKKFSRPFQSTIHAKRTHRELKLLRSMNHENIIDMLDVFTPDINASSLQDVFVFFFSHFSFGLWFWRTFAWDGKTAVLIWRLTSAY